VKRSFHTDFFTVDELKMRSVRLTDGATLLPRSCVKIKDAIFLREEKNCVWYEVICEVALPPELEGILQMKADNTISMFTVVPSNGVVVREGGYILSPFADWATYVNFSGVDKEKFCASCLKVAPNGRVTLDQFHLLSGFTTLFMDALTSDGRSNIYTVNGNELFLEVY
jgi:hypothetical protein